MRVFVAGSGSSGNSVLFETERARLLVDCGIGPRGMGKRLRALDVDFEARALDAILPTHEHADHFGRAAQLARTTGAPLLLHRGIAAPRLRASHDVRELTVGQRLEVGDLSITTVAVPHDAPNVAVRVEHRGVAVAMATDLGHVPRAVVDFLATADVLLLEANHCPRLLAAGPYPASLKRRVLSDVGHLSNEQASAALRALRGARPARAYLVHLSAVNNDVDVATRRARASRPDLAVSALAHGAPSELDLRLDRRRRSVVYGQMSLPF